MKKPRSWQGFYRIGMMTQASAFSALAGAACAAASAFAFFVAILIVALRLRKACARGSCAMVRSLNGEGRAIGGSGYANATKA